jgi:large subunit ribosomal protein L31
MRAEIHPTYYPEAKVSCASCGATWTTGSTRKELRVDVCSNCHPFFTGEAARLIDIEGQVDRFYKKLQARQTHADAAEAREAAKAAPERTIEELGLATRATDALKKSGIASVNQLLAKLGEGDEAVLAIAGFGQSSLTAAKKKLRSLGYDIPEAATAA